MSARAKPYQKLPGTGHQLGSFTKLYRGEDHLLQVTSVTFSETYKRFYFRDIQAFTLVRTPVWLIWAGIAGFVAVFMLGVVLLAPEPPGKIVAGSVGSVFLLIALSHLLRGPSCRCCVQTAVQTEVIPSLSREDRARKVLQDLKPLIEAAQQSSTNVPPAAAVTTAPPPA